VLGDATAREDAPMSGMPPSAPGVARGVEPRGVVARWRELTRHREARRVAAFLFAGGISAAVTIAATALLTNLIGTPFLWSAIAGTELGILINFAINDHMAFRDLAGHARTLPVRLIRFHATCALGQTVILLLSLGLHDLNHWSTVFAQAAPIGVVTIFNFAMHRFWTYRGGRRALRPADLAAPRQTDAHAHAVTRP